MRTVLGHTWMDSGKLFVIPFLLLIVTVVGLHRNHRRPRWLGTSGVFVLAALAWLVLGTAIEFWGFPIGSYDLTFEEEVRPVFKDGYWLQALGTLFATLAFVPFGIHLAQERVLPAWMVPVLLFGATATVFLTPAFFAPGVVWIILGLTLLRYQGRARRGSNPRPSA